MTSLPGGSRPGPAPHPAPRSRANRLALIALLASLLVAVAACGTSGRAMQSPKPGATAPPRRGDPTTTTTSPASNKVITSDLFTIASGGFPPGGTIPKDFTCDGGGGTLPFNWANVPAGTAELVLTIIDPDAENYVHWVVAGIAPTITALEPPGLPVGTVQLLSSAGTPAYAPPCPPPGETHTYEVTLYALGTPSGLTAGSPTKESVDKLATEAIGTAVLTGDYTRASAN